jgi:membrane protein
MNHILRTLRDSFRHWRSHHAQQTGAALSYYAVLSLIPLLGLITMMASTILDRTAVQTELFHQVANFAGTKSALFLQSSINNINLGETSILAAVFGIAILALSALGGLRQLQRALDSFWNVSPEQQKRGIRQFFRSRLLSLSLVPILALILALSLLATTLLDFIPRLIGSSFVLDPILGVMKELAPLVLGALFFAYVFRYLSGIRMPWRESWIGALVTAILFTAGKNLIDLYLTNFANTAVFGAAGALVAIMIWIFMSVQMFLFGASVIYVYSREFGMLEKE